MDNGFLNLFGNVFVASGALGIDGKGYWYDKLLNWIPGHNFDGATFIAKTVTVDARDGNLPLKDNLQPRDKFPKCVKLYPFSGHMMNAVGVSSPGLQTILESGVWDNRTKPFLISIIPVRQSFKERVREIQEVTQLILKHRFSTMVGIQLNVSCPNTEVNHDSYFGEIFSYLSILKETRLPIDLKVNILVPVYKIIELINLSTFVNLQAITCSNTIPYKSIPEINWDKYSGLESMGGGGLSGPTLLPYVVNWIKEFRNKNKTMPIKACGGIFSKEDVDKVVEAGANAIEIGTVKLFRPHRVKGIIKRMEDLSE